MPAKSAKQQRFMAMCANSPGKAQGKCPPKKVAKEFSKWSGKDEKSYQKQKKKMGMM